MKELDFDELHEAVSAIMDEAGKPKAAKKTTEEATKSAAATPDAPKDEPKSDDEPKAAPASDSSDASKDDTDDTVPIIVKRPTMTTPQRTSTRGRAMDIMQPKATAGTSPTPSRTAKAIQPTTTDIKPDEPASAPTLSAPASAQSSPGDAKAPQDLSDALAALNAEDEKPAPKPHDEHSMPDPLDVHKFKADDEKHQMAPAPNASEDTKPLDEPSDSPNTKPAQDMPTMSHGAPLAVPAPKDEGDAAPAADASAPAGSPFVTTKVEKRPLNAYADKEAPGGGLSHDEPAEAKAASVPLPPQPAELSPEVVAVESIEPEFRAERTESNESNLDQARQMAIPQQYHTADKEPHKDMHPVFDTKDYHPPLQPAQVAHHGGSGIGWVLVIILILLVLGSGAAIYLMMTGSLDLSAFPQFF